MSVTDIDVAVVKDQDFSAEGDVGRGGFGDARRCRRGSKQEACGPKNREES